MAWNDVDIHRSLRVSVDVSYEVRVSNGYKLIIEQGADCGWAVSLGKQIRLAGTRRKTYSDYAVIQVSMLAPKRLRKVLSYVAGKTTSVYLFVLARTN